MSFYDFASPGGDAVDSISAELKYRDQQKRLAMLDALNKQNIQSEMADREANRRIQEENAKTLAAQRQAQEDERKQKQLAGVTSMLKPEQDITGTEATKVLPGFLQRTEGGATLPSTQMAQALVPGMLQGGPLQGGGVGAPTSGGMTKTESPSVPDASVPTRQIYTGTPQQVGMKTLSDEMRQATEGGKPLNKDQIAQRLIDIGVPIDKVGEGVDHLFKGQGQAHSYVLDPATGKVVNTLDIKGEHDETHILPKPNKGTGDGEEAPTQLPQDAIDMAAAQLAMTGNSPILRALGIAKISHADKIAIVSRAAQFDKTTNKFRDTPGAAPSSGNAPNLAGNAAATTANANALKDLVGNQAAIEAFANTAGMNTEEIWNKVKHDIPDWGVTWLNTPIRSGARAFGSEAMSEFDVARQSLQSEYGRLISQAKLSGAPLTDSARHDIDAGLTPSATVGQFDRALQTLQKESNNRRKAFQQEIDKTKGALGGTSVGGPTKPTRRFNRATGQIEDVVEQR